MKKKAKKEVPLVMDFELQFIKPGAFFSSSVVVRRRVYYNKEMQHYIKYKGHNIQVATEEYPLVPKRCRIPLPTDLNL